MTRPVNPNPNPTYIFGYKFGKFGFRSNSDRPVWPRVTFGFIKLVFGFWSGQIRANLRNPWISHEFSYKLNFGSGLGLKNSGRNKFVLIRIWFGSGLKIRDISNLGWSEFDPHFPDSTRPVPFAGSNFNTSFFISLSNNMPYFILFYFY